jgi:hypothetical protein
MFKLLAASAWLGLCTSVPFSDSADLGDGLVVFFFTLPCGCLGYAQALVDLPDMEIKSEESGP